MSFDPDAFRQDLEAVSARNGAAFERLQRYWQAESKHVHKIREQNEGTLLLFRAFQCLFLETVGLYNGLAVRPSNDSELPFYTRFVPRLIHAFQQLSASELTATHGYPLPAYTLLRNTFDSLILVSAAMQGVTDFFSIEGSDPAKEMNEKEAKKLRINTEFLARKKMTGKESGLSEDNIEKLQLWDAIFDLEVHGAKLSLGTAIDWIQGRGSLPVHPEYRGDAVALYSNRLCEISWMAHRLVPLLQHSALEFPQEWAKKWRMVDGRFRDQVQHFAKQQENKVGLAIIELVTTKFAFSEKSLYPLEVGVLAGSSSPSPIAS